MLGHFRASFAFLVSRVAAGLVVESLCLFLVLISNLHCLIQFVLDDFPSRRFHIFKSDRRLLRSAL